MNARIRVICLQTKRIISPTIVTTSTRNTQIFERSLAANCAPSHAPAMEPTLMKAPATHSTSARSANQAMATIVKPIPVTAFMAFAPTKS
jgi:hypothetical protein